MSPPQELEAYDPGTGSQLSTADFWAQQNTGVGLIDTPLHLNDFPA